MEELDLLKKDWQKNENSFTPISENEIYGMLHKKSSSVVKWIFYISILEFLVMTIVGFLLPNKNLQKMGWIDVFKDIVDYSSYFITVYFIYLFYKNYKSISTISNTKNLMVSIIKTRKTVKYYIYYNIIVGLIFGLIVDIYIVRKAMLENHKNLNQAILQGLGFFVCILILIGIVWLFYKLIYGRLLKKLTKNYDELKKIDL